MNYISVEEFLKQSEKVQENLLNWWKENVKQYDIFYRKSKIEGYCWNGRQKYIVTKVKDYKLETITLRNREISAGRDAWTEKWNIQCIWDIVPLFTETQLRKLIEDKTECKVQIHYDGDYGYTIDIGYSDGFGTYDYGLYDELGHDLLKAYWKVVCEIVQGED